MRHRQLGRGGRDSAPVDQQFQQRRHCFGIAAGGGIDFGETPEETLAREFKEETGLLVGDAQLFSVTSDVRRRPNGDGIHTVRIIYRVELLGGELTHEVHGTTDHAAWYPVAALADLNLADYAREAIQGALRK